MTGKWERMGRDYNLKKKNKSWGITLSDFRQQYKTTVIKRVWFYHTKTGTHTKPGTHTLQFKMA